MLRLLAPLLALVPLGTHVMAQAAPSRVAEILDQARAECLKEGDAESPAPELLVGPAAVTWTDLDGDEEKDDAVVDFNHLSCNLNRARWGGTGGAPVHFVIDDAISQSWSGWNWQVIVHGSGPLILLSRHGLVCDGYGAQRCVQAIAVDGTTFSTPIYATSLEQDEGE